MKAAGLVFCCLAWPLAAQSGGGAPPTPKHPVIDQHHGVKVVDDYRWLEDFSSPAVREWLAAQNRYTREYLDRIPGREAIRRRLEELVAVKSSSYFNLEYRAGTLFAWKRQPQKEQLLLITVDPDKGEPSEHIVVDPTAVDPSGGTSMDFYVPSFDGRMVAVSLSEKGSEDGTLWFFDVATGKPRPDKIPRVNYPTAGGSAAWNADGTGIYYTRLPHAGERPKEDLNFYQQVWFHKLGTPLEQDTYVIGREFPRIAEIRLTMREDGRYLLATVANGDGGEYAHYVRGPSGAWTQVTRFSDQVSAADFGPGDSLCLLSRSDAPRGKILRVPLAAPKLANAKQVVRESASVIAGFQPAASHLYVVEQDGGPSRLRVYTAGGGEGKLVPTPPVSAITGVVRTHGDEVLFGYTSFTNPGARLRYDPRMKEPAPTALRQTAPADYGDIEVVREFAVSKDGTRVPLNILRRRGMRLDGSAPALLTGYGGYSVSLGPYYSAVLRVWLDHGVYAVANLRGGGEYGEPWHAAGKLTKKQNVFDDFIACARHLIASGYTSPARLAIEGGSNGGLLIGAVVTQEPKLFRAAVAHVGIFDMLRFELEPNGAFNTTEFGTVKNADQFRAMYAYSPYHRVRDGVEYPAVLLVAGDNDHRVDPAQSRKMAARLQSATRSRLPVLLRTSSTAGHGIGTAVSERIEEMADVHAFLFEQLGIAKSAPSKVSPFPGRRNRLPHGTSIPPLLGRRPPGTP